MYRAMFLREFKLLAASYKLVFAITFLVYGILVGMFVLSLKGMELLSFSRALDPFVILCALSLAVSGMFLFMTAPTSIAEKSLGILDNILAYTGSPRPMLIARAAFLSAIAFATFLFWSAAGLVGSLVSHISFVDPDFLARDVLLAILLYPLFLFCVSLVQVFTISAFPHLAQLVNILVFGLTFLALGYYARIAGTLMAANVLIMALASLFLCGIVALLCALFGRVPCEILLRPT